MDWQYGLSSLLPIELPHNVTQIELSEKMNTVEVNFKDCIGVLQKDTESAFLLVKEDIESIRKYEERLDERIDNCSLSLNAANITSRNLAISHKKLSERLEESNAKFEGLKSHVSLLNTIIETQSFALKDMESKYKNLVDVIGFKFGQTVQVLEGLDDRLDVIANKYKRKIVEETPVVSRVIKRSVSPTTIPNTPEVMMSPLSLSCSENFENEELINSQTLDGFEQQEGPKFDTLRVKNITTVLNSMRR
jgi:hypothetical protein